ncbi:GIY-YIG nuclease family protein [Microbacterium limosum]|uniref:GIY-YIG nuclease family protein n=1 Tax=Microbacterium limosum TaxID=3079935 RepID=A0AAU0MG00_9MICO|nr:GIY-YIG nuclease family protein [Microbacterium sp. Y20]WOQ68914.1 GIY-YIG nuclease family protein [Microbacterium sp. Y20]
MGDAPDADLERPRVDVLYYLRYADRIKIGTSGDPRRRLAAIRHDELLAFERGGRELERARHAQFATSRLGGEWFADDVALMRHVRALESADPWRSYDRWVAASLVALC